MKKVSTKNAFHWGPCHYFICFLYPCLNKQGSTSSTHINTYFYLMFVLLAYLSNWVYSFHLPFSFPNHYFFGLLVAIKRTGSFFHKFYQDVFEMSTYSYDHDAYEPSITVPASFLLFLISSSHFSTVWLHMVHRLPQSQRAVFTTHNSSMLTMAQPGTPLRTGQGELGLRTLSLQMESIQPPGQPLLFVFPLASLD